MRARADPGVRIPAAGCSVFPRGWSRHAWHRSAPTAPQARPGERFSPPSPDGPSPSRPPTASPVTPARTRPVRRVRWGPCAIPGSLLTLTDESRFPWSANSPISSAASTRPGTSGTYGDVYDPNTGRVQARVPLAGRSETEAAIADAAEAQVEWGEWNPQRRARVLLRFLQLVEKEKDSLARLLSSEHGKTVADAHGDIQRGLEVVEFAAGIPHLLKGEFTDSAGAGIDVYSLRQPLGVVAGHHAVQLPGDDPAVEGRTGARLRQRLHPQAVRAGPVGAAAAGRAVPRGGAAARASSTSSTATGRPSTRCSRTRVSGRSASSARRRSPRTSTRRPPPTASGRSASAGRRTT